MKPRFLIHLKNLGLGAAFLALMSCQPGAPVVTVLGQVSGFELTETTQILKSKNSKSIFYISGKCNSSISDIEVSFDSGTNFTPLSQFAETFTKSCSGAGTYSYKINPNNTSVFDIPTNASYKDFKFRGIGEFGPTAIANLRRMVTNAGELQITAGSTMVNTTTASGTPVILKARIISSSGVTNGTNYKFTGAIRIK